MYGGMESYHAMCRFYSGYVHLGGLGIKADVRTDSSTSMSFWPSTNGTGAWNQRSSISVTLHSMSSRDTEHAQGC